MVSGPSGFSRSTGGYLVCYADKGGPDLASLQTVPVAVCALKSATTPSGEQVSRR